MTVWELIEKGVVVDIGDLPVLFRYTWYISSDLYVVTNEAGANGGKILLHRFLLNAPDGSIVDHRDLNTLNNSRGNLRVTNRTVNRLNSNRIGDGISRAPSGRFVVRNTFKGQRVNYGTFNTYEEALAKKQEILSLLLSNESNQTSYQ